MAFRARAAGNHLRLCRALINASPPPSILRLSCSPRHQLRVVRCLSTVTPSNAKPESVVELKGQKEREIDDWKIKMLYDGDCPLCMKEVNMLRERNERYKAIKFVDISSDDYSPAENEGLDYETAMGRIHVILSDGTVAKDVEAFRRLYEEVGLGWVYAITKYEPVATIADSVYSIWAKYRMQITGRPPLNEVFEARRKKMGTTCTDDKVCKK